MPKVGDMVTLTEPLLGNEYGTAGICYDVYASGSGSYIFPNGHYDGFNSDEIDLFLKQIGNCGLRYTFTNVMQLSRDFDNGLFTTYFKRAEVAKYNYTIGDNNV